MMTKNDKIKSKGTSTPADSSLGLAIGCRCAEGKEEGDKR